MTGSEIDESLITLEDLGDHTFLMTMNFKVFNFESIAAVNHTMDKLDAINGPIALITTGGSKKIYSAGMDFVLFSTGDVPMVGELLKQVQKLFARFMSCSFPTIAAINGHCIAGGAMFSMAHDFRVVRAGKSKFYLSEVDLGMEMPGGMLTTCKNKLDNKTATDLILFGKNFYPDEALACNIVNKVTGDDVVGEAKTLVEFFKNKSKFRFNFGSIKRGLNKGAIDACLNDNLPEDLLLCFHNLKLVFEKMYSDKN